MDKIVCILLILLLLCIMYYTFDCGCYNGVNNGVNNGIINGFSVGCQTCSEYTNKEVCDGPCEWNVKTNTCSERSVFCNPNVEPKQFCPNGIPCPNCGTDLCECPKSPGPSPAPSPTPGPQSCENELNNLCGSTKGDPFKCARCAGENQQQLEKAGCTNDEIAQWCASDSPSPSPYQDGYFQINNKTGEEIVIEVDNKAGGKLIGFFDDNKISPSNLQKHATNVDKKYIILPIGQTMYVNVDFYQEYESVGLCAFKNNIQNDLVDDRDCINRIEWSIKVPNLPWFDSNQIWINNSLVDGYNSNMDVEVNIDGTPETFACNLLDHDIETTKTNCQSYGGKWTDGDRNKMNDTINDPNEKVAKCINPKNWLTWKEPTGYDVDKFNILGETAPRITDNPCPSLRSWYNNDPKYNVNGISRTRAWHKNITLNQSEKCGHAYSFPNSENFPIINIDDPMFMNNETWWCPDNYKVDGYKDASHIEDHLKKTQPPIFYDGDVLLRKTIPPKDTNKHTPHVIINITKVA